MPRVRIRRTTIIHPRNANSVCGRAIEAKGIDMKKLVLLMATVATIAAVAAPAEARGLRGHRGAGAAIAAAAVAATVADAYVYGPRSYYGPAPGYYGVPVSAGW
jgi:hypothetical protein